MTRFNLSTVDAEERAELEAVGVRFTPHSVDDTQQPDSEPASGEGAAFELAPPSAQAEIDAAASEMLRRIRGVQRDRARVAAARAAEHALIDRRYDAQDAPLAKREAFLASIVHTLALRADFGKKAKSRKVGHGEYGRKQVSEKFEIRDEAATRAWAMEDAPELVRGAVKVPYLELRGKLAEYAAGAKLEVLKSDVAGYYKSTGDLPPGCEIIPAYDEPYCKPLADQDEEGGES